MGDAEDVDASRRDLRRVKVKRIFLFFDFDQNGWVMEGVYKNGSYGYGDCPATWRFVARGERWMYLEDEDAIW